MYEIKTYNVFKEMIWDNVDEATMNEDNTDDMIVNLKLLAILLNEIQVNIDV